MTVNDFVYRLLSSIGAPIPKSIRARRNLNRAIDYLKRQGFNPQERGARYFA